MTDHGFSAPKNNIEYHNFFNAVSKGDIESLKTALLPSLNVNSLKTDRWRRRAALHMAAETGSVPAIQFLLAHGAKVDLRNSEGETPLHRAAYSAHPKAIRALLAAGADINLPAGYYRYTALHNVLKDQGYKDIVPDPDTVTVTPQQIKTIKLLLDRGLDLNAEADSWGTTLIVQASELHNTELVRYLIDRGARLGDALLHAVENYDMVNLLLSRGAKVVSAPGKTSAITNAAGGSNIEVIQLLLSHAKDAELAASDEALTWAASVSCIDTVKLLIEHGFDVNVTPKDSFIGTITGETPLLAACASDAVGPERMAVAKLLMRAGADINARRDDGKTAAEQLVQKDIHGLIQKDAELQQLLAGSNTR